VALPIPNLDDRRFDDLVQEARAWIIAHCPAWTDFNPSDPGVTLVELMAWLTDLTLYRVNRIPDRSFVAFLDLMGVRRRPAEAARTWLIFEPRILALPGGEPFGAVTLPVIEAHSVVQARRESGPPVEFSTLEPLTLTAARPRFVVFTEGEQTPVRPDPPADDATDVSLLSTRRGGTPMVLAADTPKVAHLLFLGRRSGQDLGRDNIVTTSVPGGLLHLDVTLVAPVEFGADIQWEQAGGSAPESRGDPLHAGWRPWNPVQDTTRGFQSSGRITFRLAEPLFGRRYDDHAIWLRARLLDSNVVQPPELARIAFCFELPPTVAQPPARVYRRSSQMQFAELPVPLMASDTVPAVEVLQPFGAAPGPDSALLIGSPLFRRPGAVISISIVLRNDGAPPDTAAPELRWEMFGTDGNWILLGRSTPDGVREIPGDPAPTGPVRFTDGTNALTRSGTVTFRRPDEAAPFFVMDEQGWFLRIRVVAGVPHRLALRDVRIGFIDPPTPFDFVVAETYGQLIELDQKLVNDQPVLPFDVHRDEEAGPILMIGFVPAPRDMLEVFLDLLPPQETSPALPADAGFCPFFTATSATRERHLPWSYATGGGWKPLIPQMDTTRDLTTRGAVGFVVPQDWVATDQTFGQAHWLRVRLNASLPAEERPRLAAVATNAVEARNAVPLRDFTFVTSAVSSTTTSRPWDRFKLPEEDILPGVVLAVQEELTEDQLVAMRAMPGLVVQEESAGAGQRTAWIRWEEVQNFFHSERDSRHYVIDYVDNSITFGDGRHGRLLPAGTGRIRLVHALKGGGRRGNVPALTVNQMQFRPDGVAEVYNPVAAEGGEDAEPLQDTLLRGPHVLQHRERAVTAEDFEWLARESSRNVRRAHCFVTDGVVNVLIIPAVTETTDGQDTIELTETPYPGRHLIGIVEDYLNDRRTIGTPIRVTGPDYVEISLSMDVALKASWLTRMQFVRQRIEDALRRFIHPIVGGPNSLIRNVTPRELRTDGDDEPGWPLGRALHISEIYYLVEQVEGVDYAQNVRLRRAQADDVNVYQGLSGWTNKTYSAGDRVSNVGNAYQCITGGTSTIAPAGTGSDIAPGGVAHWKYLSAVNYDDDDRADDRIRLGPNALPHFQTIRIRQLP
jgi:predicted phage baseplate assembly protein